MVRVTFSLDGSTHSNCRSKLYKACEALRGTFAYVSCTFTGYECVICACGNDILYSHLCQI